jgi:hypothetical protein
MKLKMFNPPGNMTDFEGIPGQRQQWNDVFGMPFPGHLLWGSAL